jgi:hypothetical protein
MEDGPLLDLRDVLLIVGLVAAFLALRALGLVHF